MLTLNDQQKRRSLCGMKLVPDERLEIGVISRNNFIFKLCSTGSTALLDLLDDPNPINWRQFHELMLEESKEKTTLVYGHFFPEVPTNPDVVAESLNYCCSVAKTLGQEFCVLTCDQAIYEIVLSLQKKHSDKYGQVIIRMGGFHIAMNFLCAIGHLMNETGLKDILTEVGVYQPGTAKTILGGKGYYAMIRAHSVVEQAVFCLLWEAFEDFIIQQSNDNNDFSCLSTCLGEVITSMNKGNCPNISEEDITLIDSMQQQLDEFTRRLDSPSKLWIMYLKMIGILCNFIAAERAGAWDLHIQKPQRKCSPILSQQGTTSMHHAYLIISQP